MIEKISNLFNNNKIVSIIIIILALVLIGYMFSTSAYEHMSALNLSPLQPVCVKQTDDTFNQIYVKPNKLINFKCTVNGIDYYLANIPTSQCTNPDTVDCGSTIIILIPTAEIDQSLQQYLLSLDVQKKICNSTQQIQCVNNLHPPTSEQSIAGCNKQYDICNYKRFFVHDFLIQDITRPNLNGSDRLRSYLFNSTNVAKTGTNFFPTMLNQHLYYDKNISSLCGDVAQNMDISYNTKYNGVSVIETVNKTDGIVGANPHITIKLAFKTQKLINGVDDKGNPTLLPTYDRFGDPIMKTTYVGCAKGKICNIIGGKSYPRVCLLDDALDPNILSFTPKIVF